ncbi:MAG: Gfo/Idh/MocA family oxidoreductase [Clostridia bacterium]|nr:Gfo/Idh/MocA family oxidoreductase [Clostridia bacterium]
MSKLKIGIVGNGGISQLHAQSYQALSDRVEIYALCDVNKARALAMAERLGVPSERVFDNVYDMVRLPELDAVNVCTWNNSHSECTITALDAGKHVLCEKPMALNAEQAKAMKAAAVRNGKHLQIGFVRRFGNDIEVLRNLAADGFFGEIYYAKVNYTRRNGCPGGWFSDRSRSGGGPLIDLGVHVIDFSRYLMGNHKPVSVYGATFDKLKDRPDVRKAGGYFSSDASGSDIYDVEDLACGLIRFDNGSMIAIDAAFSLNQRSDRGDMEFFGTKGGARITDRVELFSQQSGYMTNTELCFPTSFDFNGSFLAEIKHFVDCITVPGTKCISPADDGIILMEILDGLYESARTGHEVILS